MLPLMFSKRRLSVPCLSQQSWSRGIICMSQVLAHEAEMTVCAAASRQRLCHSQSESKLDMHVIYFTTSSDSKIQSNNCELLL